MPNYILAQESNRANIPDALWYAMEETDLEDISNNESLSTGDKVYVIKANKTFIFGEDANWYPYANEGGGGGSEGVPDAPSEQGNYVLSVGASDNEWVEEAPPMFGFCDVAASTANKTAAITGYIEQSGITVFVAFAHANTATNPTLNINQTGAYPIKVGSYTDPGDAHEFAPGVHAFTLVQNGNSKYWMVNEGRDTVPEAPTSEGDYLLRIRSTGITWSSAVRKGTITLTVGGWSGDASPYTQTVSSITGATFNTKIDLQPNVTALAQMQSDGTTNIFIDNDNATLTAYAMGAKPTAALTIQYTRTEVAS